jgi:cytochrome c553
MRFHTDNQGSKAIGLRAPAGSNVTAVYVTAVFVTVVFVTAVFVTAVFVTAVFVTAVFVTGICHSSVCHCSICHQRGLTEEISKYVPFLHSESSHSLPTQPNDTILALNES